MSDESDETRSFSPFDETEADGRPPADESPDKPGLPSDKPGLSSDKPGLSSDKPGLSSDKPGPDETQVDGDAIDDDATKVAPRPDATPDATSVMPPAGDDWAPSRANPVWSGRAEVRPPQPGRASYDTDWQSTGPTPAPGKQTDRWWMPIVVGIIVLILLALLGWGIYLIVQNSKDDSVSPSASTATTAATTAPTSAAPTTPTSAAPTTTTPSAEPTTTEPTTTEVLVPALLGLSLDDARDALNQTGLRYRVLYQSSSTAPQGIVIDSDPPEGQVVPPDTRVTIVVAGTDPSATPSTSGSASAGTGGN
jgi:hypothetical protein